VARRSASNARYQKYQEPAGQTRKSAAAAKPTRSSSSAPAKKASGKSAKGSSSAARRAVMVNPTTPEFKRIRKIWWGLLLGGLILTTVSWAVRAYVQASWAMTLSNVILGMAYAAIFYALYLDWTKMRPMRQAAYKSAKNGKPEKTAPPEKPSAKSKKSAETPADDTTDTTGA